MRPIALLFAAGCMRRLAWLGCTILSVARRVEVKLAIYIVFLTTLTPEPAFAYIDPGTGGFILQAIVGAIAAGVVALKMFWSRILSLFTKRERKASSAVPAKPPEEGS